MTDEMLERSRAAATVMDLGNVEFRRGLIEDLPVEDACAHGAAYATYIGCWRKHARVAKGRRSIAHFEDATARCQ
jgi:hypothetical protein